MAGLQDIREGLAGNMHALVQSDLLKQVSASLLDNPSTPCGMVAGVAPGGVEYQTYGGPDVPPRGNFVVLIEVALGLTTDIGAQTLLNRLLSPIGDESLVQAIEADPRLTLRFRDGEVIDEQEPAAEAVSFREYRGQTPFTLRNGTEVLLAVWAFDVGWAVE